MCCPNANVTGFVVHETADLQIDFTFRVEFGELLCGRTLPF
jgi:hypothetical protein